MPEHAREWPEHTKDICARLNNEAALVVCAPPSTATQIAVLVEDACDVLSKKAQNLCGVSCTGQEKDPKAFYDALPSLLRVQFTTPEHQVSLQTCIAVHGRAPFLAYIDMRGDDGYSYVLNGVKSDSSIVSLDDIVEFFTRIALGIEPRALQGAAPPPNDSCKAIHGVLLTESRCAVTSTFERLKWGASHAGGGAVCVFWCDRCPCCPSVLMMVNMVVMLIRTVVRHHTASEHDDCPPNPMLFQYMECNIDENDLPDDDWPAGTEQVVPTVVAYTPITYKRVQMEERRTPENIVKFLCTYCLPTHNLNTELIQKDALTVVKTLPFNNSQQYPDVVTHSVDNVVTHGSDTVETNSNAPATRALFDMDAAVAAVLGAHLGTGSFSENKKDSVASFGKKRIRELTS